MSEDRNRLSTVEILCIIPGRTLTPPLAEIQDPDGGCCKYYGAKREFGGDPEDVRWFTRAAADEVDALVAVLHKIGAVEVEVRYLTQ